VAGRLAAIAAAALVLAACSPQTRAQNVQVEDAGQTGLRQVPLTIQSRGGTHRFTVEIARTPEQQAQGLMHRQSLAPDRGMLFPYDPPQDASFWMKNTLIPLDIIFIRADGRIARIAANTTPHSLEPVPSGEPVATVLEIRGGLAAELGIAVGDQVSWRR
jgi:uncharacterized membrane protein (UPF0127 family)